MLKRIIITLIAAVLLLTSIPALAATPSKTTEDLIIIIRVLYEDGSQHNEMITIQPELTEFDRAVIKDLKAYKAKNDQIVDYFTADVKDEIQKLLPQDVGMDGFIMSELVCLCLGNHDLEHGTMTCEIEFPTEYKETNIVVPLVGYKDALGNTAWLPVKAKIVDGHVIVELTEETLSLIGHDFILAILSK